MDCIREKRDCEACMSESFRKLPPDEFEAVVCSIKDTKWSGQVPISIRVRASGEFCGGMCSKETCNSAEFKVLQILTARRLAMALESRSCE